MKKLNEFLNKNKQLYIETIIPFSNLRENDVFTDAIEEGYFDVNDFDVLQNELQYIDETDVDDVIETLEDLEDYNGVALINIYNKYNSKLSKDGTKFKKIILNKSSRTEVWVIFKDIEHLIKLIKSEDKKHTEYTLKQIKINKINEYISNVSMGDMEFKFLFYNAEYFKDLNSTYNEAYDLLKKANLI